MDEYMFYDSKRAVNPEELRDLYRFTSWGKSRSVEQIERMVNGTSLCFSVRNGDKLIAFCRMLTDFVFRGSIWDIIVHPDHQGRGLGSKLLNYALTHPAVKNVPVITVYASDMVPFLERRRFERSDGLMVMHRGPIEYS
ncbi:GNAT family acetyltransferase [Synergistales bacterium]|nr:GNAT family acetyltransferase [Synergistales bacterium]